MRRPSRAGATGAAILGLATMLSGCGPDRREVRDAGPVPASAPLAQRMHAEPAGGALTGDEWIAMRICAALREDPVVRASRVDVSSQHGQVRLAGLVTSQAAREQAVSLARKTPGVVSVAEQLPLHAGRRSQDTGRLVPRARAADRLDPAWVTASVRAKYFQDPVVSRTLLDLEMANGVLTLRGWVDSLEAQERAVRLARATNGVAAVRDELQLRQPGTPARRLGLGGAAAAAPPQPDDLRLATRIGNKLYADDELRSLPIELTVHDGIVELRGRVPPGAGRHALALAAATGGVAGVRNELEVVDGEDARLAPSPEGLLGRDREPDGWGSVEGTGGSTAAPGKGGDVPRRSRARDDTWTTTVVLSKLYVDPVTNGLDLRVNAMRGVVTVTGRVPDERSKMRALLVAGQTSGVEQVIDQIRIETPRASAERMPRSGK